MQIFKKYLLPLLEDFGMNSKLHVTQKPNEAQEFLRNQENLLEKYSGIVIVSGDGLLYEVIQG